MTSFLATLSPKHPGNWEICKRNRLWGIVGRGNNWRSNAQKLRSGDRVFVWRSGRPDGGVLAQIEALGPVALVRPGDLVPWNETEPNWFGAVFPMRVTSELATPVPDSFPRSNGQVGLRFGFNNIVLQHIFEEIPADVANRLAAEFSPPSSPLTIGTPYVATPPPAKVTPADPFAIDPDMIDRGLSAHHATLSALAAWVTSRGLEPRLPALTEPQYDLAWIDSTSLHVAEVKSITIANEEKQLRLGLGQVLRYQHQLFRSTGMVVAWLVPERQPVDPSWVTLAASLGVRLAWPGSFH
jgi:hypothetical protein